MLIEDENMSSSPAKHKSSRHHHREHHHSGEITIKPIMSLASHIKIEDNSRRLPRYSHGKLIEAVEYLQSIRIFFEKKKQNFQFFQFFSLSIQS